MQERKRTSFQAVRQLVQSRIEKGIWPQGTLLPTESELAEEFGCARATVNRALRELADGGFVERRRKSGTRVTTAPVKLAKFEIALVRKMVEEQNADYRYTLVNRSIDPAPAWLSSRLGLGPDRRVLHVLCMHYANNRPFQFEERWVNLDVVPEIEHADLSQSGPNEWLLANVPFTDAEMILSSVPADARIAEFLATSAGTSVMQIERTTWKQGIPVTFVRMTHHPGFQVRARY